jgi:hypothetical protein
VTGLIHGFESRWSDQLFSLRFSAKDFRPEYDGMQTVARSTSVGFVEQVHNLPQVLRREPRVDRRRLRLLAEPSPASFKRRDTRQTHGERAASSGPVARRLHRAAVKLDKTTDDSESDSQAASDAL